MMQRRQILDLSNWISRPNRKPLIVKGARQVGKSTLVKLFAAHYREAPSRGKS